MGGHSTAIVADTITPPASPSRKRKRDHSPAAEIEVDVSAPEPPSKKTLRKAKKGKTAPTVKETRTKGDAEIAVLNSAPEVDLETTNAGTKRSDYGLWIGNLPWTVTKLDLCTFFTKDTGISDDMITRVHMPPPSKHAIASSKQRIKPQNQGFAYVDLSSETALAEALGLSEKLITGRRVLIKDAKSFEGRPEKPKGDGASAANAAKPPSKRIFIGNLGFDTTKEILKDHFARCGEVLDVHVATFEDTGKCKGYAWIDFTELEAGEAAVRGWVNFEQDGDADDEDHEIAKALADEAKPKKKPRLRKWWVNRLEGRPLRMEFAEGKEVRYKKRYGKEDIARNDGDTGMDAKPQPTTELINEESLSARGSGRDVTHRKPARKIDARNIKPGAALAAAPRLTGGIVESQGKKTTFA